MGNVTIENAKNHYRRMDGPTRVPQVGRRDGPSARKHQKKRPIAAAGRRIR
jgi:hypothetical protein